MAVSDRCASARLEIAANRLQEIEDYVREYAPHVAVPSWTEYLQLGDLGLYPKISEITVKVHRSQVIRKMKVSSLPDLARMADKLNFTADGSQVC